MIPTMNFLSIFFKFVFWQDKSTWLTFTGYFSCFFQFKFTLIDFNFVFWHVKSNKVICILHLCFDRKNPANWFEFLLWHVNSKKIFEFVFWQRKSIWLIFTGYFIIFFQIKFAFWQKNWVEFCVLTGKIK